MIGSWKRVRIAKWTSTRNVRITTLRKKLSRFNETRCQMLDNLIGITIPAEHPDGIVVMPIEHLSGYSENVGYTRQFQPIDCTTMCFVVEEQWLELLGDAYDEEIRRAKKGARAHQLRPASPEVLALQRLRERALNLSVDEMLAETVEADKRKDEARNRHKDN